MNLCHRFVVWLSVTVAVSLVGVAAQVTIEIKPDAKPLERPFLWRIETTVPSYLFGTMHVADPRVTTLPPSVDSALDGSDAVYGELDITPALMSRMLLAMLLPRGETLASAVGEELATEVEAELEALGMPKRMFRRWRPWAAAMTLPLVEAMRSGSAAAGVSLDEKLLNRGRKAGRRVSGLETMEQQIGVFEALTREEQAQYLKATVDEVRSTRLAGERPLERMIELYVAGDEKAMMAHMSDWQNGLPAELSKRLTERLLTKRNLHMADEIVRHLQEAPGDRHFFAVGAAHLFDDQGLIDLLTRRGYKLTRVPAEETQACKQLRAEALRARRQVLQRELEQIEAEIGGR